MWFKKSRGYRIRVKNAWGHRRFYRKSLRVVTELRSRGGPEADRSAEVHPPVQAREACGAVVMFSYFRRRRSIRRGIAFRESRVDPIWKRQ